MCEGLTARQFVVVELFLKVDRRIDEGCNSWIMIPTSLSAAVGGLLDNSVDATKDSESMRKEAIEVWRGGRVLPF